MLSEISARPTDPTGASSGANFIALSPIEVSSSILNTTVCPGDITITERFVTDSTWSVDLVLDSGKSNWDEWIHGMRLVDCLGFADWLDGTPAPN